MVPFSLARQYVLQRFTCITDILQMPHSLVLNSKVIRLQEECLRIVYRDNNLSYKELSVQDNSFCIQSQFLISHNRVKKLRNVFHSTLLEKAFRLLHRPVDNTRNSQTLSTRAYQNSHIQDRLASDFSIQDFGTCTQLYLEQSNIESFEKTHRELGTRLLPTPPVQNIY